MSQPDVLRTMPSASQVESWWTGFQRRLIRPRLVLRMGRQELSLWRDTPEGLQHLAAGAAPQGATPLSINGDLRSTWLPALVALMNHGDEHTQLDVIVESAWMPVSLVEAGTRLWSSHQIQSLARHRLSMAYGDVALQWVVQSSYLTGDAHALVFGLPRELQQVVEQAAQQTRKSVRSMQPALAWGWDRSVASTWAMPGSSKHSTFWWIWPEQDRDILVWVDRGRISGLNPAAISSRQSPQNVLACMAIESARLGIADGDLPIRAMTWDPVPATSPLAHASGELTQRLRWDVLVDTIEPILATRGIA